MERMSAADAVSGAIAEEAFGSIYSSQYADAQQSARANKLAKELGLPPEVVEADYPNMVAEARVRRARAESEINPTYARMMSNPRLAAAATDDDKLPQLAANIAAVRGDAQRPGFDDWARRLRESTALSRGSAPYQLRQGARGEATSRSPRFADRLRRHGPAGAIARSLRDTLAASGASLGQGLGGLLRATGDILFFNPIPGMEDGNPLSSAGKSIARFYGEQRELTTVRYDNWYIDQMARGLESVPAQVTALLTAAAGQPQAGIAMLAGISGGQSYDEAREEGLSVGRAAVYAGGQAGLEAAGEALPILRYADDALRGSGFMKRLGGQLVAENVGEQFTGHLQDLNRWAAIEANQGKTFLDYLDERPGAALAIALSTSTAVGVQTGAAYSIEKSIGRIDEMRRNKAEQRLLSRVMDGAGEVSTRSASPDEFKAALAEQLEGTAAENIYIPAETVRTLFQSPSDMIEDGFWGDYVDAVAEAEALGGDVSISLADAATRLAGTPQWEQLKEHARLSPGGSSQAEIAQWEADFADAAQQTGDQLAAMLAEERDAAEPVEKVYEAMRDKLMLAGYTPDAASALAVQYAQRRRVRAERLGVELTGAEADAVEVRRAEEAAAEGLNQEPITAIRGDEIASPNLDIKVFRKTVRDWYNSNLRGTSVVSKALGREVKFAKASKAFHIAANPKKLQAFAALRTLIENAPLIETTSPADPSVEPTTKFYHYLEAVADIGGERTLVGVTIREDANGNLYYNHSIREGDPAPGTQRSRSQSGRWNQGEADAPPGPLESGNKAGPGTEGRALSQGISEIGDDLNLSLRPLGKSLSEGTRGRITFMGGGTNVIELFEKRDLSTFIHETGHLYLEELKADAGMTGDGQLLADWETVKAWFKANGHEIGEDSQIPTEAHELWARGFERYAMEGKAPSSALRKAFEAFRSWLLTIYKVVDNLRSPITPEIRDVMARLMATDQEIAEAAGEQNISLLFKSAEEAGMTGAEYDAYVTAATEARDEAYDALLYRTMAPIRAARTKEHREREAAVRAEIMAQIDEQPLYRALRLIRSGDDGQPMRLDRQWLVDTYGEDVLQSIPKSVPPLFADKGTMDADVIAERAGFTSGDEMIRTLIGYEDVRRDMRAAGDKRSPRQAAIDELTAEAMAERYGDPLQDGSIEAEARALIHNDRQGEVIAAEVRSLARRSGNRPTPYSIARKWAREKIRSGTISEVISGASIQRYQRAARNAAKAAETAMLEQNVDEAFRHKQAQMLNNALIAEATRAKDAVDSAVARLAKTAKRKTSKSIDQDYLDQAHSLLESVEFRQRSQRSIDRQLSFEEWAAEQRANGVDVVTPGGFAASIGQRHWSRLTVEELTGLDDTVKQILHLGRLKQTLLDGQERRARDEVIAEMAATAGGVGKGPPSNLNDPSRSFTEGAKSKLRGADAALIKIEQLVDWLDRGNPNGIFNRMIFKPLADAQAREADLMRDYISRMNAGIDAMPKKQLRDWRRRVDTPELINRIDGHPLEGEPWSFYKDQIVMIALNMGNAGNRQRLLDGYGWSEVQAKAVLDRHMTAEDWAFVQHVWDTIDTLWSDVEALEKRVNGVAPDKVEATPVETPYGTFRGGYFPAVYDPQWSSRTADDQDADLLERGYVRANVQSSATKARAERVKRPMLLSMDVITRHLGQVIHDITHREALTETWKLVSDERVQRIITNALGREYSETLRPWLKHIANDQARNANSNSAVVNLFRRVGHNVTIVGLGFRFMSSVAQIAGMPNIIAQIGERRMIEGWGRFLANPLGSYREVTSKSGEMRDRFSTMDRDLVERAQQRGGRGIEAITGPGWFTRYAFHGILLMDAVLTTAGWIGAYRKGVAEGMSDEEAIYFADKIVRKSQGAGGAKDQAAITREHEAVKLFVKFFSYFSALYSQQRDFAHRLRRVSGAADLGRVMHFGFWAMVAPPLLDALIRGEGPGGDEEDDESVGMWVAQKVIFGNLASIPGVRDIGGAIDRDFGYKATPVQNIGESVVQGWGNIKKTLDGDDDTEASSRWVKQTITLFGLTFGKPTGQIGQTAQFGYDVAQGEAEPETVGQWKEGLIKGRIEETAE